MSDQTIKILAIGMEPGVAGYLLEKGFPIKLFSFADKSNFYKESVQAKIIFVKWDGAQKHALQILEQIKPSVKKTDATKKSDQAIILVADKIDKEDKLLVKVMKQYGITDLFSLTGELHKIEMLLFELTGKLDNPDDKTPYIVPEFLPIAFHETEKILVKCRLECTSSKEAEAKEKSFFFFAPNPDLARSGVAILKKIGCRDSIDFSDVGVLTAKVALNAPDVLIIFHESNRTDTQVLLDRIADIRKQAPGRIQIICPGETALADFAESNRSTWYDQALICTLNDKGFKEALERLSDLELEESSPRKLLLDLRKKVQSTTIQNADQNTQDVWKMIVKVAELPGRRYWAKLEHMYFFLAGGSNKKALEEVAGLLEMNPGSAELRLVKLNLLSTLGRDYADDLKILLENFSKTTLTNEDLISITRFAISGKRSDILQSFLRNVNVEARKEDSGFHYMNAVYAGMIGDKSSEGHWLRSALHLAPTRLLFLSKMGQYLSERKDYRDAIKFIELSRVIAPEKRLIFDLMIADFLFSEGSRLKAEQKLIEVLKEFPDNKMSQQMARKLFPDTCDQLIQKFSASA